MTVWTLKLLAMISMLFDHLGCRLGWGFLHGVGRLAFPIFAFLIGNGFHHTGSRLRYILRLLVLAALSQIPYTLCIFNTLVPVQWNIFFTLALGLGMIWALCESRTTMAKLLWCILFAGLCWAMTRIAPLDYGYRGVALIVVWYFCDSAGTHRRMAMGLIFAALYYLPIWQACLLGQPLPENWQWMLFALAALPMLFSYRDTLGYPTTNPRATKALQWGFYAFYPVHLLLLWLLFA